MISWLEITLVERGLERGAQRIPGERKKPRQSSEPFYPSDFANDALAFRIAVANECDPENIDLAMPQCLDRQQRMIDGAERGTRAKHNRKPPPGKDVDVKRSAIEWHHQPTAALDHKRASAGIGHIEYLRGDAHAVNRRGMMLRRGRF